MRHIQLKTLLVGGKASDAKIGLKLMEKPSGCVIWIVVTPDLHFDRFLWFGGLPGAPLPDIRDLKVAKRAERPAHRLVPRRRFEKIPSLDAVLVHLFGSMEVGNPNNF